MSGFGPEAAALAGRIGDGFWGNAPDRELLGAFEDAGGKGPRYAQLNVCWASSEEEARRTVYETWPNTAVPGTALAGPAHLDPLRAGDRDRHRGRRHQERSVRPRHRRRGGRERRGVRGRGLRPPVLPPDRWRPGGIPAVLGVGPATCAALTRWLRVGRPPSPRRPASSGTSRRHRAPRRAAPRGSRSRARPAGRRRSAAAAGRRSNA